MYNFVFKDAKFRDGYLMLKPSDQNYVIMARRIAYDMKPDVEYLAKITRNRQKRSQDANAYFWVLCGKLASVLGLHKNELYRQMIQGIGDNFEILPIRKEAIEKFVKNWESNGVGWVCERTGTSKLPGYENVIAYYGSSTYDTKQMSRLIDLVVQECREQDIETLPPDKLAGMLEDWDAQRN